MNRIGESRIVNLLNRILNFHKTSSLILCFSLLVCNIHDILRYLKENKNKLVQIPVPMIPLSQHLSSCHVSGRVPFGLKLHPDKKYLIYPLGSLVILKRTDDGKQEFLHGHSNNVSCISLSKSGVYIASGQVNVMAVKVATLTKTFWLYIFWHS